MELFQIQINNVKSTTIHKIHKQTLDIRFRDFTTLHAWTAANQAKTVDAVRKSLEQCLEEYDFAKEYLTIDRLELDLGVFSADQLLTKMPENLYQELQKILSIYHVEMNNTEDTEIIEDAADKRKREPIVKNCLLYTSPSPRDRQKSRMPSSA